MRSSKAITLVVCSLLFVAGCVDREAQKQGKRTEALIKDKTVLVTAVAPTRRTMFESLEITGEIVTSEQVEVSAKSPGRLIGVYVKDGDSVRAGQVIAVQDGSTLRSQLRQALSQVNGARAALNQAISNAKVGPEKSSSGVAQAEAALRSAKAQLAKVRKGARSEEINQAKANLAAAKSNMDTAKKERDRQLTLLTEGAVSKQRYEQAENAYQNALSGYENALQAFQMAQNWTRPEDLTSAQEQVRQAEEALRTAKANQRLDTLYDEQVRSAQANLDGAQAQVSIIRDQISDTTIRSPLTGRINGRPLQSGTMVGAGSPICTVIGSGGTYFEAEVPESRLGKVVPGSSVLVTFDSMPGIQVSAKVSSISPSAGNVARIFKVKVMMLESPSGIKPGMFARGAVRLNVVPEALVVPTNAILGTGADAHVFVAGDGKAKKVLVVTGLAREGVTQVTGLSPADKVIVKGGSQLAEGTPIRLETEAAKD